MNYNIFTRTPAHGGGTGLILVVGMGNSDRQDEADNISAIRVAEQVGLDVDRLRQDMEDIVIARQIEHSWLLAEHMGLMGTPTFIAGHNGLFGKQSMDSLRQMIADARRDLA